MNGGDGFFDTNVLLYCLSANSRKARISEDLLAYGGTVSVQVLNEFASVASRKLGMPWTEVREVLATFRQVCRVEPLTLETHECAMSLSERYRFAFYDSMILAAAILSGCPVVWTEDLQDGQRIDDKLTIRNPFH